MTFNGRLKTKTTGTRKVIEPGAKLVADQLALAKPELIKPKDAMAHLKGKKGAILENDRVRRRPHRPYRAGANYPGLSLGVLFFLEGDLVLAAAVTRA